MLHLGFILFDGVSIFAWALLLFMVAGMGSIVIIFVADGIYEWFDNRAYRKQQRTHSSK